MYFLTEFQIPCQGKLSLAQFYNTFWRNSYGFWDLKDFWMKPDKHLDYIHQINVVYGIINCWAKLIIIWIKCRIFWNFDETSFESSPDVFLETYVSKQSVASFGGTLKNWNSAHQNHYSPTDWTTTLAVCSYTQNMGDCKCGVVTYWRIVLLVYPILKVLSI